MITGSLLQMELTVLIEKIDKMRVTAAELILQFTTLYTPAIFEILQILNDNSQEQVTAMGVTNMSDPLNDLYTSTLSVENLHMQTESEQRKE